MILVAVLHKRERHNIDTKAEVIVNATSAVVFNYLLKHRH